MALPQKCHFAKVRLSNALIHSPGKGVANEAGYLNSASAIERID
jgi:hypothetical protein